MNAFKPDTIIAFGGGSPMDAAKIMWLLYEHRSPFDDIAMRFMDIRKRVYKFPKLGAKATMVAIPPPQEPFGSHPVCRDYRREDRQQVSLGRL